MVELVARASWFLPLIPVAYLLALQRQAPGAYWLAAFAFLASWPAEMIASLTGGSLVVTYLLPPVQIGLFGFAFGVSWLFWGLLAGAVGFVFLTDLSGPDMWLHGIGSALLLYVAMGRPLGLTVAIYCGLGTATYLLMMQELWRPLGLTMWYIYHAVRAAACGMFIYEVRDA